MFNLLINWKNYFFGFGLLTIVSFSLFQHLKIINLEKTKQICHANLAAKNIAIQAANEMRSRQMEQLRLREQEAAKARAESLKRRDMIMQLDIKGGCEGAIQWMIDQSSYEFIWHNNIPKND